MFATTNQALETMQPEHVMVDGIVELRHRLACGTTTMVLGPSGAGKTTLGGEAGPRQARQIAERAAVARRGV